MIIKNWHPDLQTTNGLYHHAHRLVFDWRCMYELCSCMCIAGLPAIIVNTLAGAYIAYAMSGLRDDTSSIVMFGVINVVHAVASIQLLICCIFLTTSQVIPVSQASRITRELSGGITHLLLHLIICEGVIIIGTILANIVVSIISLQLFGLCYQMHACTPDDRGHKAGQLN